MKKQEQSKYERAHKKVASIKGFYNHLVVYFIVNLILFFVRHKINIVIFKWQKQWGIQVF